MLMPMSQSSTMMTVFRVSRQGIQGSTDVLMPTLDAVCKLVLQAVQAQHEDLVWCTKVED